MRFLIVDWSGLPALGQHCARLGHPDFSETALQQHHVCKRYHVPLGLAGSCSPLTLSESSCDCQELSLPPAAAWFFAGICPSWARAHLQHTRLSPNIILESCRCCTFVFIEKQILRMAKAISSKHTVLERDVLEVPLPVHDCKSE